MLLSARVRMTAAAAHFSPMLAPGHPWAADFLALLGWERSGLDLSGAGGGFEVSDLGPNTKPPLDLGSVGG